MKTIKPNSNQVAVENTSYVSGLYLSGKILQRTKRTIAANGRTIEIVTYLVVDDNRRHYYIDDYSPNKYFEIDQMINIPIYIKPYKKKSGDLSYSLNVLKPFQPTAFGEVF